MANLNKAPLRDDPAANMVQAPPVDTADLAADAGAPALALGPKDDFARDVWCLLGLPVDISNIDRAVAEIEAAVRDGRKLSFVTPNVNWLVRAMATPQARREILNADLSFIDGAPLVALAKTLGVPAQSRVAGADIFEALRRRPAFRGGKIKVFFFGGREGAGQSAMEALASEAGGVEPVGCLNPGYGDVESMSAPEIIDAINAAGADFVVVALGAAKGQAWIERNKSRLNAPVTAHLGAVIDFTGGEIARAPEWIKKSGLEWLWRIKEEPSLWKRYYKDGVALVSILVRQFAPQMRAMRPMPAHSKGEATLRHEASNTTVMLSGILTHMGLNEVRDAFRTAAARQENVTLDFSNLHHFDRAFLGLVLMLEKHLAKSGNDLSVAGASSSQRALLRANAMNYAILPPTSNAAAPPRRAAMA